MAGNYEKPVDPELPDTGPSFREFATAWTSGELARRFPDHIRVKKTAEHDVYRLDAHVYPVVGDIPIARFRTEDAELVMRALPSELAGGSRRQVAQLIHLDGQRLTVRLHGGELDVAELIRACWSGR